MRIRITLMLAGVFSISAVSCRNHQQGESEAVRDGIRQHLSSLNTLNLNAMDMSVSNVKIAGNEAQADVEYTPKSGGATGGGMKVSYLLEKRGEQWVVVKKSALTGALDHPTANGSPNIPSGEIRNMPNFRDILPPGSAGTSAAPSPAPGRLPPGHPPVSSAASPKQPQP